MPDIPDFVNSPFAEHPTIDGWALVKGNRRWIDLLSPSHPDREAFERIYIERTAQHHGIKVEELLHTVVLHSPQEIPLPGTKAKVSSSWKRPNQPIPEYPPISTQVGNFAKAMGRQVKAGFAKVSAEVQEERLSICRACVPYFDAEKLRCRHKKCGCRLSGVMSKTSLATEHCPIGKWPGD